MNQRGKPDRFEAARLQKLEKIVELGHDPFGRRFDGHQAIGDVVPRCPRESGVSGEAVRVAGRIMSRRKAGKLRFYDVEDATGRIQLLFSRGDLSGEQWELMSQLDMGDLIGIDGRLRRTDSDEPSILVEQLPVIGRGAALWTCLHLDDAAAAFQAAIEQPRSGIWHVVDDAPVSVRDFLTTFAELLGARPPRSVPVWLARLLAGRQTVEFFTASTRTNNSAFGRDFDWRPEYRSYQEGLRQVVEQWRQDAG